MKCSNAERCTEERFGSFLLLSFQKLQFCDAADLNCVVLRGVTDIQGMKDEERDIDNQGYAKKSIRTLDKS